MATEVPGTEVNINALKSDNDTVGRRDVVPGGAHRDYNDTISANWCTLDYESVRGLAETNFEGDKKYGIDNWAKGLPASNLLNHTMEHLFKLLSGDNSEPHIEHAMWNLGKLRWMARNRPDLIDLPRIRLALGIDIASTSPFAGECGVRFEKESDGPAANRKVIYVCRLPQGHDPSTPHSEWKPRA